MEYKKVLVVSNNGFSETSSNGRTLGNFFIGWPKEKLAQFCISMSKPNWGLCDNYFIVTDYAAISAFKHARKANRVPVSQALNTEGTTSLNKDRNKRSVKTALKAVARSIVWSNKRWKSKEFSQWVNGFNPEVIVVVTSDSAFIHNIAIDVAETLHIPIVMFCTEGFYFFKKSHMRVESLLDKLAYPIYKYFYQRNLEKLMSRVSHAVYGNSKLESDYQSRFQHASSVLYTSSTIPFDENDIDLSKPVFSYLGNLGLNRPKALIEIAQTLQKINVSYKLDIYGKGELESVKTLLRSCDAIRIMGTVPYAEVQHIISKSTILFHGESQEPEFQEGLKYGFTTKIADSIASGSCFLMYSSHDIAGAKYIMETDAAWFAETRAELEDAIREILTDKEARKAKKQRAKILAQTNHNIEENCRRFNQIINGVSSTLTS